MKSKILIAAFALIFFLGLVYFNYLNAQSAIKDTRPSILSIELTSFPESLPTSSAGTFIWLINASPDLVTGNTTIYWSYESTPSALTRLDSPQAVSYPNSQADYASGSFSLPDSFSTRIKFPKPGKVYFRAYAKVNNLHLWSEEKSLDVIK